MAETAAPGVLNIELSADATVVFEFWPITPKSGDGGVVQSRHSSGKAEPLSGGTL